MNLYPSISTRKSCRSYDPSPLDPATLAQIDDAIKTFTPLIPDAPLSWRIVNQVKGFYHVRAPHYLIISGKGQTDEKVNAGFLFQQLVLWFDAMNLGCVWLGESKDAGAARAKTDIITIAFGRPIEPAHRTAQEFKRKEIAAITNAPNHPCIQAAHLAPSGMNLQPWFFDLQQEKVFLYQQRLKPPFSLVYKHTEVDMGIVLCHYYLACTEYNRPFSFSRADTLPEKAGFIPFGVLSEG